MLAFDTRASAVTTDLEGLELTEQVSVLIGVLVAQILNAPEGEMHGDSAVAQIVQALPQHYARAKRMMRGMLH